MLRNDLYKQVLKKIGEGQISSAEGKKDEAQQTIKRAYELLNDLEKLRLVPETKDIIEEMHLIFLARCRLLELGNYIIKGLVGAGQCGVVYKAHHKANSNNKCALKVLFYPRNQEELSRFINEGNLLNKLNHPTIVKGITSPQTEQNMPINWFAMEYIENAVTFGEYCNNFKKSNKLFELKEPVKILSKVCEGLAYAHKNNIVHRDLHLGNILIIENEPKILDFGSAKFHKNYFSFRPVGGLKICAPENLINTDYVDGKADIFAIGCILYYLITNNWPFYSNNYGEWINKLLNCQYSPPPKDEYGISDCIAKILQKDPKFRPTAMEIAMELKKIANNIK